MANSFDLRAALMLPPLPSNSAETLATLHWARGVMHKHLTTSYAVTDPKGIEELKPIKIGGVDQWLHIRGRNRNNPILLYLHGGPGAPMIGMMDATMRPWEDYFTIVHWDQRQVGKSYYPANDEDEPLTINRHIEDTEEVIQYLQNHLNHDKLFVLGHSWGTVLGMHMAKRHPDWLHAYIGIGQVVNKMDNERVAYERLVSHAIEQKENELLAQLEAMAPYPDPDHPAESYVENSVFVRKELSRLAGETMIHHLFWGDAMKMWAFDKTISPHLTLTDLSHSLLGDVMAGYRPPYTFTKEYMTTDLPKDIGSSFEVPIFFFTGAHEWQVPRTLSDKWFAQIESPYKELVHFEESSHSVVNEEPGKVLIALVNKVLPLAKDPTGREVNHA